MAVYIDLDAAAALGMPLDSGTGMAYLIPPPQHTCDNTVLKKRVARSSCDTDEDGSGNVGPGTDAAMRRQLMARILAETFTIAPDIPVAPDPLPARRIPAAAADLY